MRQKSLIGSLLLVFGLVNLFGTSTLAAPGSTLRTGYTAHTTASSWKAEPEECAFLTLINQYRINNGLSALTISKTLSAAAEDHSIDMGMNNYFSHTLSDGTTWSQNIANHGYPTNTSRAENIAAGRESAAGVFDQWKNSPPHNANMLSSKYSAIGIGRAQITGSTYTWYWTNTFGSKVDQAYTCSQNQSASTLNMKGGGRSSSSTSSLLAFDGDLGTAWYTTKSTPPRTAYIFFDLGSSKNISKISWYFSQNGSADSFKVEISTDKSTWTTVTNRSSANAGTWQTSAVNQSAQYVRFYFNNPNQDAVLGYLAEVKMYP